MQVLFTQFLTALRNMQQFLDANSSALGNVNSSGARKDLDDVGKEIAALADAQGAHRLRVVGERRNEYQLARQLRRKFLKPIVRIARAKLPNVPQFQSMVLPLASGNTAALASFAQSLVTATEPFAQVFVDSGLPTDFGVQTRAAAEQLLKAIGGKGSHRVNRVQATDGIAKHVRLARHAVSMLDALVLAELDEQSPLVAGWRTARLVLEGRGSSTTTTTTPPSTAPAPGTPVQNAA